MGCTISLPYVALWALAVATGYVTYQLFLHPLARIPGPRVAAITNLWSVSKLFDWSFIPVIEALHRQHGPIVRIGPNEVSIQDVAASKIIYSIDSAFVKEASSYRPFNDPNQDMRGNANLFTEARPAQHADRRRLLSPAYAPAHIQGLRDYIEEILEVFISKLDQVSVEGEIIDMSKMFQRLAFDVAAELAFAGGFDLIGKGDHLGILAAFEMFGKSGVFMARLPLLQPLWFNRITQFLASKGPIGKVFDYFGSVAERNIKARQGDAAGKHDMLTQFIATAESRKFETSFEDLKVDIGSLPAVGTDSTGFAMSAFLHSVCGDHAIYARLEAECDDPDVLEEEVSRLFAMSPRLKPHEGVEQMIYFKACLQETFRLYPSVPGLMARLVPSQGAFLANRRLPAGTVVGVTPYVQHRIADVFGDDVDVFRPERWLDTDADRVKNMHDAMIHFGGGRHGCIGLHMAQKELKMVLPRLIREFRFELIDVRPLQYKLCNFAMAQDVNMRVTRRI